MEEWVEGSFEVWSPDGSRTVHGVILAAFGVHHDSERNPPGWVVAHTKTRLYVSGRQPFKSIETAKKFVERILPLPSIQLVWDRLANIGRTFIVHGCAHGRNMGPQRGFD
jgi:hypothetical protein